MRTYPLVVCVLTLISSATADIKAGTVTLKPSGVLSMIAEWEDTPKDGAVYAIYLLTTIQSSGTVLLHILSNLQFETNKMSYNIPSGRQDQFIAGNTKTSGTFPGFALNNQYRVYISYKNAAGVSQNKQGGQDEMSLHASPMVRASAVQVYFSIFRSVTVGKTDCVYISRHIIARRRIPRLTP
jgi:hypothetical protein